MCEELRPHNFLETTYWTRVCKLNNWTLVRTHAHAQLRPFEAPWTCGTQDAGRGCLLSNAHNVTILMHDIALCCVVNCWLTRTPSNTIVFIVKQLCSYNTLNIFLTILLCTFLRSRSSVVGIVTGLGVDGLEFESWYGQNVFPFSKTSIPVLGSTQPLFRGFLRWSEADGALC